MIPCCGIFLCLFIGSRLSRCQLIEPETEAAVIAMIQFLHAGFQGIALFINELRFHFFRIQCCPAHDIQVILNAETILLPLIEEEIKNSFREVLELRDWRIRHRRMMKPFIRINT